MTVNATLKRCAGEVQPQVTSSYRTGIAGDRRADAGQHQTTLCVNDKHTSLDQDRQT